MPAEGAAAAFEQAGLAQFNQDRLQELARDHCLLGDLPGLARRRLGVGQDREGAEGVFGFHGQHGGAVGAIPDRTYRQFSSR